MHRRDFLRLTAFGSVATLFTPFISFAAAPTERRFIFIIQRGAADGLNTLIPYADPDYARLRGQLAIDIAQANKLDGMFALHPSLATCANLYASGQALFVHAVASPYRERSHFDAQNVLETGGIRAYERQDGWLNRLLGLLPQRQDNAIAFSASIPMGLRGQYQAASYAPDHLPQASDDLITRISALYAQDPQLSNIWASAMDANNMADGANGKQDPASLGKMAATFLAKANGPRIAMIETGGWDTHSGQDARLSRQLKSLDTLIAGLRNGLGDIWQKTTVLVATEFGRTAAANGTGGTDHGTASACLMLGGDINGGRIITDWPGLSPNKLYQNRDLNPTMDMYALLSSTLGDCFGLDSKKVAATLFGRNVQGKLMQGIIRT